MVAKHYTPPKANGAYWAEKVARNAARDADTARLLEEAGWLLVVVWEHDDPSAAARRITELVRARRNPDEPTSRGSV